MKVTTLAVALATTLGSAGMTLAAPSSYFTLPHTLPYKDVLNLGTITAANDGVVKVFANDGGKPGALLGMVDVHQGANTDVKVNVGTAPATDIIAVLTINGRDAAMQDYNVMAPSHGMMSHNSMM
ncbi:MAG: hypothetical protein GC146_10890 [Limimaricola sp.]|uniref:hypothetical protein n=1 Tax=Limimaricola sp. TaxID=2211665 RepID=UPI001DD91873|nr:hypothetical protein [Limimaricola sp.]MBI1417717.1 hypothetical protein [Limimaricola sp.]